GATVDGGQGPAALISERCHLPAGTNLRRRQSQLGVLGGEQQNKGITGLKSRFATNLGGALNHQLVSAISQFQALASTGALLTAVDGLNTDASTQLQLGLSPRRKR